MNEQSASPLPLHETAIEWLLRMEAPSDADRRNFRKWLLLSPSHVTEYLRSRRFLAQLRDHLRPILRSYHESHIELEPVIDAVDSVAPFNEREAIGIAWSIFAESDERDLALWAEDAAPVSRRIGHASGEIVEGVPETTLKLMAGIELRRRTKRHERIWWIVGIVAASILSPIIVTLVERSIAP